MQNKIKICYILQMYFKPGSNNTSTVELSHNGTLFRDWGLLCQNVYSPRIIRLAACELETNMAPDLCSRLCAYRLISQTSIHVT